MVIALGPHQELPPEGPLRLERMLDAIVLRRPTLTVLLALLTVGRDYVGRSAQLRQRGPDGGAGRLLGLEENEFMLVRDDHEAGLAIFAAAWLGPGSLLSKAAFCSGACVTAR